MSEEFYPMPMFPLLAVHDLEAAARFYQEALGFRHVFTIPGPQGQPVLVHLRWSKYADLVLLRPRAGETIPEPRGAGVRLSFNLFDRSPHAWAARS